LRQPLTQVQLVNQPHTLQACVQELTRFDTLSFDIEFDNNSYGYGLTLCVVQVATPSACYVVDGLAGLDLASLYTLFQDPHIQKIVHTPGEDLRLLHSLGCYPQNLYDTEVPARLLNYEHTSLSTLLREKLDFEMNKTQQRSNWLRRPLTKAQVQYAADDVIWLHLLKAVLEAEAAEQGLLSFVMQEQDLLSTTVYPAPAKNDFLRPADQYTLSPKEQYVVNALLRYRDEVARNINRPPYQVIREEFLRELAASSRQPESILQEPGIHPRFKNHRFSNQLRDLLAQAKKEAADQNLSAQKQRGRKSTGPAGNSRKPTDDREKIFVPVKQALVQRFGVHAATFLLSNRLVNELLSGAITLQDLKPAYRQELIYEIAAANGIDLGGYT
jgi:ribonuclease D